MKLLCVALVVLVGQQVLTNPRKVKQQPAVHNPVLAENTMGCKEDEFQCDSALCVSEEKRCDGVVNCQDGSDEDECLDLEVTSDKSWILEPRHEIRYRPGQLDPFRCKEDEFQCDHIICVSKKKRCDGIVNCEDGTDEDECVNLEVTTYKPWSFEPRHEEMSPRITFNEYNQLNLCKEDEFLCDSVLCVSEEKRCDGIVNCEDGTDENECLDMEVVTNKTWAIEPRYRAKGPEGCGGTYFASKGTFKYPYSGKYKNYENCGWSIRAGEPIKFTIVRVDIESCCDELVIRDGPNPTSPIIKIVRGQSIPKSVQTIYNSAYLQFKSDYSITGYGFEIRWEPASDCVCGQVNRARIVNGVETEVNEYPWQAALVISNTSHVFCGGSVIGPKLILTAAHCTQDVTDYRINYQVLLGAHRLSSPAASEIRLEAERFIQNQHYNKVNKDSDISIIILSSIIDWGSTEIRPICLPTSDDNAYDSVTATISGWGKFKLKGIQPDVLMEVDVPTMTNRKCLTFYPGKITDNMLCAGYEEGRKDSCQGDSGGAIHYNPGTGYTQIGVVSWGEGCACFGNPGVYVRVSKYLDWIRLQTGGGTGCTFRNKPIIIYN